jgi:hypothetical protein
MHFFYIDESGCDGRSLTNTQEPIFVSGGVVIRDKGWNQTHIEFEKLINAYFNGSVPDNFEFHTQHLFSENGSCHFEGHSREQRNKLIQNILDLIIQRKHQYYYFAVDKAKLNAYDTSLVRDREYVHLKTPYMVAYDYLITCIDQHIRNSSQSSRAMVIIDEKDSFIDEIEQVTRHRRFQVKPAKRIKQIVEFSYAVDSEKNTMVQISDLMLFLTRKFLEIENGYKETLAPHVKDIFREFYRKINTQLIFKKIQKESGRNAKYYNQFIESIGSLPTARWNSKRY